MEADDLCLCFYFCPCLILRIVGCYVIFIYSLLFLVVWCNLYELKIKGLKESMPFASFVKISKP